MYDILIVNARIVDGSGNPGRYGSVAVKDGLIVGCGQTLGDEAMITLDGTGLVGCPGFIDFHAHSDVSLLVNPRAESAVRQGITTQVSGNCGFSPAPLAPQAGLELNQISMYADLADAVPGTWQTMAEYLALLRRQGSAINVATHVGSSNLRRATIGENERSFSAEEMTRAQGMLAQALEEGAWGLSTGLSFVPDLYNTTEELIELGRVVRRYGRIYATHMRDYTAGLLESTAEAIRIGEEAGIPVDIAHFSGYGYENWGRVTRAASLVEAARARGVDVAFDNPPLYPWGSSGGGGLNLLPPWALEGGTQRMLERMRDPHLAARAKFDVEHGTWHNWIKLRWDDTLLTKASTEQNQRLVGRTIAEIAGQRREAPIDTVFSLLLEEQGEFHMAPVVKSEEDIEWALRHPLCKISSDGAALAPYGRLAGSEHLRSYGTFPRALGHYVRERAVLTLEEAVRKMTSTPADRLGLKDRGLLRPGYAADICLFNPETVIDRADWAHPEAYPIGVQTVIVNGQVVIHEGEHSGALPGQVLVP
jgi:N-acyl-D-amino-acid deacylase